MKPQIVVLDGYTLNPGDLDWTDFQSLGLLTVYDRTPENLITKRIGKASIALTNKTPITSQTIKSLPNLKYIGVLATGTNVVDIKAANQNSITVTNTPAYGPQSVAQHAIALLLELTNRVAIHNDDVHNGKWTNCQDFCFTNGSLVELSDKTLGLVGLGAIASRVAKIANALGMNIIAHTPSGKTITLPNGKTIDIVGLDQLFAAADVVSLHCPLTPDNENMVNEKRLATMKQSAFLINTARGPLVDEHALTNALNNNQIAGAGLDVLSTEPPKPDNPLLNAKNCVITPHNAWASRESRQRLMNIAENNLRAFLNGQPENTVR